MMFIVGTLVVLISTYLKERKTNSLIITKSILIGGILVLVSVVWSSVQQSRMSNKFADAMLEIKSLNTEIANMSKDNADLNKEIAKLSSYNLNILTGGDSFPFTSPAFNVATPKRMDLWLVNKGKYPLYDVSVVIIDLMKFKELVAEKKSNNYDKPIYTNEFETKIDVGNMRPGEIKQDFYAKSIAEAGEVYYRIEIVSRNSSVLQMLHIKFTGDGEREILEKRTIVNGKEIDKSELF